MIIWKKSSIPPLLVLLSVVLFLVLLAAGTWRWTSCSSRRKTQTPSRNAHGSSIRKNGPPVEEDAAPSPPAEIAPEVAPEVAPVSPGFKPGAFDASQYDLDVPFGRQESESGVVQ